MAKSDEAKRLLRAMSNVDDKYIEEGKQRLDADRFVFIDIREALTEYINNIGKKTFDDMYENFGKEVYRSENSPKGTFFYFLMEKIGEVLNADKSPVLVHTGTLYDLDIQNIHIMEDEIVLRATFGAESVSSA